MASSGARTPRSVPDATRFTPTTPHAASKATESASTSRFQPPSSVNAAARPVSSRFQAPRRPPPGGGSGGGPQPGAAVDETPEQRVARLRAQHLAARNAEATMLDKFVARSRPILDRAHQFTVMGLIGFSAIAAVVTVYAAYDMMVYNRKRKSEFIAAQKALEESSLHAARLAYMRGDATPEQVELVEEAKAKGLDVSFFGNNAASTTSAAPSTTPVGAAAAAGADPEKAKFDTNQTGWQMVKGLVFGGSKSADETAATGIAKSVEDSAKAAFDKERQNQAAGGMLDQLGNSSAASQVESAAPASSIRMSKPSTNAAAAVGASITPATDGSAPPKKGWFW